MYLVTELGELLRDEIGGPVLFKPEFRVSMDVAPPVLQILVKFRNALYDTHYRLSSSLSAERHNLDAGRCQRESGPECSVVG
jgi:hypothetical protein